MKESEYTWNCQACEALNPQEEVRCEVCDAPRPVDWVWQCPLCETQNPAFQSQCEVCGSEQVAAQPMAQHAAPEEEISATSPVQIAAELEWSAPGKVKSFPPGEKVARRTSIKEKFRKLSFYFGYGLGGLSLTVFIFLVLEFGMGLAILLGLMTVLPLFIFFINLSSKLLNLVERRQLKRLTDPPRSYTEALNRQTGHTTPVLDLFFNDHAETVLTADSEGQIFRWDMATGSLLGEGKIVSKPPEKVSLSKIGAVMLMNGHLLLFDLATQLKWTIPAKATLDPDSPMIVCRGYYYWLALGGKSGKITIFNLQSRRGHSLKSNWWRKKEVTALAFSPEESLILAGNSKGDVALWNFETKNKKFAVGGDFPEVTAVGLSNDGKFMVAGYKNAKITIWTQERFRKIDQFTLRNAPPENPGRGYATHIQFVPGKNKMVVADSDGYLGIWIISPKSGTVCEKRITSGVTTITCMDLSAGGDWLAVGSKTGKVLMFWLGEGSI